MKRLKNWIIAIVLIILALYGFYQYKLNQFHSLNTIDREFIISTFGPDSDNRGFGDEGYRQMTEDLSKLNHDPKIAKLYVRMLKHERVIVLSTNQKEYWENIEIDNKLNQCISYHLYYLRNTMKISTPEGLHFFTMRNKSPESTKFGKMSRVISAKYHKGMDYDVIAKAMNADPSDAECEELAK